MAFYTVEPSLRGHPDKRPHINVFISTPVERPPLLKGHFSGAKGVASQEGFNCIYIYAPKQTQLS